MDTTPRKIKIVPAAILIVAVLVVVAGWYVFHSNAKALVSYHQKAYGFDIKYPQGWVIQDDLSSKTCCLFIVNVSVSTTTTQNASGTPLITVTAKEPIKIQIGYYYKPAGFDPFKMATSTVIALGKNTAYTGISSGTPFYLIPLSSLDGIGAAVFTSLENTDTKSTRKSVEDILSTIVFTSTTTEAMNAGTSTSTATSTTR